jgi:DNA repair exonuclease SbcCD ATPase subunit/DNA repair exonuclease SbcCD nuclease subunit
MSKLKRIYHIADIHIRNVKRHKEFREVFYSMFDEIKKRGTEDSIIYLAGDIAHAKLEMSPELLKEISWLLTECTKHCETILIAGNHDCNMNNSDRLDVLTPIVDALKLPNLHYLRDTQVYGIGDVDFAVFSIFDNKNNWPKADTLFANKKIALFHGPVDNSQTDIGYVVSSRHFTTDMFDGYDLALLGDIHKRQEMISPSGCKVVYAGSLVQQNFGETLDKHGFLVWDLDTMTYEEVDIQNDYGYYTMDIVNGIVPDVINLPKFPRLRVRFSDTDAADTKRAITEIKIKYGVEDFTIIKTDSLAKKKTGDRDNQLELEDITDVNYQNSLITDYIQRMMPFVTPEDILGIQSLNKEINSKIVIDDLTRNVQWKPLRFEFSNMFSYGEDNIINFDKVSGLMGLFAPNASGKSSLFDAISFCLFDRCSRTFKASNILNNRKSDFHCQLDFNVEGIPYFIRREARMVNNGRNVKVDVQFWRVKDGITESLNGTERRDTNSIIEQYVGRYEDFVLTALSLQGNNTLFIDKSQSERKDLMAQFMGLDIFDKLYEAANEDIKEVSALIRNFKRTDFTTELATKETDLKESKKIVNELEITLKDLNKKKEGIQNQISDLKESLTPIDSRLELSTLEAAKGSIESKLVTNRKDREDKEVKINEYQTLLNEVSQSINQHSEINGLSIDDAKKEWDLAKGKIADVQQQIDKLESQYESNLDKLKHLEQHEYDPNCQYCMNNVFVKDAIATKEIVKTQKSQLETLNIGHHALIKVTEPFSDVEDVWSSLIELRNKYQKGEIIIQKTQAEWDGLGTQYELLITQLSGIKADINRYNAISETILQNKEINERIKTLEIQKKEVDKYILDTNKKILQKTGEIGSIDSFINTTKAKIREVKDLENKNTLYTYYLDAVKKDGVPYELISKAMPVIENEVNNILAQVVDFSLSMDTDGKNINAKLVYEDQEWTLEMGSGMEKFISGLAIRVALINICGLPRPNFLVIDEGFGTLDADNLSSLFMMMQYLKTQFDFIWVISHLEQMRDIVDGLIEIKKENGFSKIKF